MARGTKTAENGRLGREDWLAHALEAIAKEGGGVLTIEKLVARLGVSRGSFYWHFRDRADFVRQLVDYWAELFTREVSREVADAREDAEEGLLRLAELIVSRRLARYDIAVRAWALHDPVAARGVRKVDEYRLQIVRSLFEEMGFAGEELETRARTFVVYYSLELGLFSRMSRKDQLAQVRRRHRLLTASKV
jgi:AcrR family transcriptional regulator